MVFKREEFAGSAPITRTASVLVAVPHYILRVIRSIYQYYNCVALIFSIGPFDNRLKRCLIPININNIVTINIAIRGTVGGRECWNLIRREGANCEGGNPVVACPLRSAFIISRIDPNESRFFVGQRENGRGDERGRFVLVVSLKWYIWGS